MAATNERTRRAQYIFDVLCFHNDVTYVQLRIVESGIPTGRGGSPTVTITTGLIDRLTDDELAGVIAHEIGHVVRRHLERRTTYEQGMRAVADETIDAMIDYRKPRLRTFFQNVLTTAGGIMLRKVLWRTQEREADAYAVDAARQAGFRQNGLADALEKITADPRPDVIWDDLLDGHPPTAERIRRIRQP